MHVVLMKYLLPSFPETVKLNSLGLLKLAVHVLQDNYVLIHTISVNIFL